MAKNKDQERAKKISESLKGRESKNKGKTYDEIMGKEKSEKIKSEKSLKARNQYYEDVMNRLNEMNIELLDSEYMGIKHTHRFKCKLCGKEFESKYGALKKVKYTCNSCKNLNPKRTK